MEFKAILPAWLKGPNILDLKKCGEAAAQLLLDQQQKIIALRHLRTTSKTMIQVHWDDLPIKPPVAPEDRRNFMRYYEQYLNSLGTEDGIRLTQNVFNLADFDLSVPYETDRKEEYPYHVLRIRISWQSQEIRERIRNFLRRVAPARSKYHTIIQPSKTVSGRGRKRGRTYGRA